MKQQTIARIEKCKLIAVLQGVKGERLIPMAEALLMGGIDCVEVDFDPEGNQSEQDIAAQISMLTNHFGDTLCVGAGTVRSAAQVSMATVAGAKFVSSEYTVPAVIEEAKDKDVVCIAGAFTPTEIQTANSMGVHIVRLFPASFMGTEYLNQIRRALGGIRIMADGGINVWNMRAFLDAGCFAVGISSSLTAEVYKPNCDFGIIAETAAAYRAIADNDRRAVNRDLY